MYMGLSDCLFGRASMSLSSMKAAMLRLETLKWVASSAWESPEA